MKEFSVLKRDGSSESFDVDKIHKVTAWATEDLTGVSPSDIEIHAQLQLHDNIETKQIHRVLISSASSLITEESPNYQYVAARLALFALRKEVYNQFEPIPLYEHIINNIAKDLYDGEILDWFSEEEFEYYDGLIKHQRDFNFTYAGIRQLIDKYLVKDRKTNISYETPQTAYMLIAMTLFHDYEANTRKRYIKDFYNAISTFKINLPTPVIAGVRTPIRQYSSCTLIDVGDSLKSIMSSATAMGYYTARRAGLGINIGRIRPVGSKIRSGEVVSTGLIPFLKLFEATSKSMTQAGIRGGGGTCACPWWHLEIEDVCVLKNNRGAEDNRVRGLDYSIQLDKLFYERAINNDDITLFDPSQVPELYWSFGTDEFKDLYEAAERRWSLSSRKIKARDLMKLIAQERVETGRIYIMNIDHCNSHSSFKVPITMSNLCQEVLLPVTPIEHIDDPDGEIAICILSAINIGAIKSLDEIEPLAVLIVRALDYIIDHQDYPVLAAELSTKKRRSLGVGITNLAYYLAKRGIKYSDQEALPIVDEVMENVQFFLLKASKELAQEKGRCEAFGDTKYVDGILPIDTYNKNIDGLYTRGRTHDWEWLREEIKEHGLRNSTLSAIAPTESSSVVSNSTCGIEPIRSLLTIKKSKQGLLRMLAPEFYHLKNQYEQAFDMPDNRGLININAVLQKYIDQAISTNVYYSFANYEDGNLPLSDVINDILYAYRMGIKTMYYLNSADGNEQLDINDENNIIEESGCEGGACSI